MRCNGDRSTRRRLVHLRDGLCTVPLLVVICTIGATAASAQTRLACGGVASGFLDGTAVPTSTDVYVLDLAAGSTGFIQGSFTSGAVGDTLRIHVTGRGVDVETCSNVAVFEAQGGPLTVEVSPCFEGRGNYRISAHVISAGGDNCGRPLPCGATPDGLGLDLPGAVDSHRVAGLAGGEVEIRVTDLQRRADAYLVRVYDPNGTRLASACRERVVVPTASGRDYTVLISACGTLATGQYRIERFDARCPEGPSITAMAFLPQNRNFVLPSEYDAAGRPVYVSNGTGTLIVEGRAGRTRLAVAGSTLSFDRLPPFQAIVSRPLGNGNPAVCDRDAVPPGGIAATVPFTFRGDTASRDRINDLGCRFDDGQGIPVGRRDPLNSCVRASFSFVDPTTDIQFCADLIDAERFPAGDTIVAARMSDIGGTFGAPREIVVRVAGTAAPTATPTWTMIPPTATAPPTAIPTLTPTPRPTRPPATRPPGPCTCDCDDDRVVRVNELTRCVRIGLGTMLLAQCPAGDRTGNGVVAIGELIEGVNNALIGCPPAPVAD